MPDQRAAYYWVGNSGFADGGNVMTEPETCAHGHPIGTACSVCTWFNLTPGYRQAILREHGLVPPSERPPTLRQRLRRWLAKFVPSDDGWRL